MFLKRLCNHVLSTVPTVNVNAVRALNFTLGKSDTELVNKWKQRFADEKISEIEPSIRHLLEHVIKKEKVKYFVISQLEYSIRFIGADSSLMLFLW